MMFTDVSQIQRAVFQAKDILWSIRGRKRVSLSRQKSNLKGKKIKTKAISKLTTS